ncbi:VOC family protein [Terasakiella sp. A23]|uniref:VOC family protein n=1 Tax=Terasakiella sp. FCG-A23 TaxID=3080561 RepID=UPI002952AFF9|nr:VOC family protein [Terasakiella sp. A23]MDV7338774.1 VOC family protein [Terasakiella sp. A23]
MTLPATDKCINYIEFIVSDIQKTKDFYAKAFGWTYTDYGPTYTEFTDGQMKGGFEEGEPRTGGPLIVLYGTDLDALAKAVEEAGGTITKPNFEFPGGRRFEFKDPDGYDLAVWCEN